MAITTTPISNRPQITPYELLRQLQTARARGGPADYYGVGAALRGVGNDYEQMQRDMDQMRGFNAKADAGYYPAQAASQVAQFNLNAYDNTDKLQTHQDLKQAFQAALAKLGKEKLGTAEFNMEMHRNLGTLGGMQNQNPVMQQAQKDMMNQRLYVASIKQATQALVANQMADGYKKEQLAARMAEGQSRGENPAVTMQKLNEDAKAWGQQHMQERDMKFDFDPTTYQVTMKAKDANGEYQDNELDPMILAAAAKGIGMPAWDNLFSTLAIRRYMAENPGKYVVDSNGKITATTGSATGATGAAGTRTTKPTPTADEAEMTKLQTERHNLIRDKIKAAKGEGGEAAVKVADEELKQIDARIGQLRQRQANINPEEESQRALDTMTRPGGSSGSTSFPEAGSGVDSASDFGSDEQGIPQVPFSAGTPVAASGFGSMMDTAFPLRPIGRNMWQALLNRNPNAVPSGMDFGINYGESANQPMFRNPLTGVFNVSEDQMYGVPPMPAAPGQ